MGKDCYKDCSECQYFEKNNCLVRKCYVDSQDSCDLGKYNYSVAIQLLEKRMATEKECSAALTDLELEKKAKKNIEELF